jgi:hypothetical protein
MEEIKNLGKFRGKVILGNQSAKEALEYFSEGFSKYEKEMTVREHVDFVEGCKKTYNIFGFKFKIVE